MLGSNAFPVRLAGLVHLANRIELFEPIPAEAALSLHCVLSGPEETRRGQEFVLVTTAERREQPVWRETMRFLARRPRAAGKPTARPGEPGESPDDRTVARWGVPSDTGRRYAQVSGDYNPIHLFAASARLFGFDRAIAHGMWSLARATAALSPDAGCRQLVLDARFRKPLLMPGEVELRLPRDAEPGDKPFRLTAPEGGETYVEGRLACDKAGLPGGRTSSAPAARRVS
jgi:acyl dehydratase